MRPALTDMKSVARGYAKGRLFGLLVRALLCIALIAAVCMVAVRAAPVSSGNVERTLSGGPGVTFERVMDVLFPTNVQQKANACFRQDMFIPAGYAVPSIPENVTAAQHKLMQRWKQDNHAYDRLSGLSIPTLVLAGTDDAVLPPDNTLTLSHALPNATVVEVKDAGHAMMYPYPRQLAQRINAFIAAGSHDPAA